MTRLPPHQWSKMAIAVPTQFSRPTKLQTEFWIDQCDANCWYFDIVFAGGTHTIKFDGHNLRTYGCGGVDSSTRVDAMQSMQWHSLAVEIDWPVGQHPMTLRHFVDGDLILTSSLSTSSVSSRSELHAISLGKAAYNHTGAKWANIVVE